jgi:hypothetical protein
MVASLRTHARRSELRASLLALAAACPFDHSNPEDCPLFNFRKQNRWERGQWFHALAEDDLAYLAAYHQVCLTAKVAARAGRGFR